MQLLNRFHRCRMPLAGPGLITAAVLCFGGAQPVRAAVHLSRPVAPEGSARTIGMGSAVVALGGDAGAVASNPATLTSADLFGGDDLSVGTGARGPDIFFSHVSAQNQQQPPTAVWGGVLNSPLGQESLLNFSVGLADRDNMDAGATLRYERWRKPGEGSDSFDGDVGFRYNVMNDRKGNRFSVGASALNLLHPSPFKGTPDALTEDTVVMGGVGYVAPNRSSLEADYCYSIRRRYERIGGSLRVAGQAFVNAGVLDKDYSFGGTYAAHDVSYSLAIDFIEHQHTLFMAGASSHF